MKAKFEWVSLCLDWGPVFLYIYRLALPLYRMIMLTNQNDKVNNDGMKSIGYYSCL